MFSCSVLLSKSYLLIIIIIYLLMGFLYSSVGKESTYNAGDPSLIPELGRSPGEGISYPLQGLPWCLRW